MTRISIPKTYLMMAKVLSKRSTCLDKQVGCILTNVKNEIIATVYNGAPKGHQHCDSLGYCLKKVFDKPNECPSAHAEQNALLQCRVPDQIHTCYTTLSPCIVCVRMLKNTNCEKIIFINEHEHEEPYLLWGRQWKQHEI